MKLYSILSILLVTGSLFSMENILYRKARESDCVKLCEIISQDGIKDRDKIVILPRKFQIGALESAVKAERVYVADHNNSIVAFKKLFIIDNREEFEEIAKDEIRCCGNNSQLVKATLMTENATVSKNGLPDFSFDRSIAIYFGGDFTVPMYRNKGINSQLSNSAFKSVEGQVKEIIKQGNKDHIVLLYGLTKINAGETVNGIPGIDRTPSIAKLFRKFVDSVHPTGHIKEIGHASYKAFMPTFDLNADECKPLPDEYSVPGYGNVLLYSLKNVTE